MHKINIIFILMDITMFIPLNGNAVLYNYIKHKILIKYESHSGLKKTYFQCSTIHLSM